MPIRKLRSIVFLFWYVLHSEMFPFDLLASWYPQSAFFLIENGLLLSASLFPLHITWGLVLPRSEANNLTQIPFNEKKLFPCHLADSSQRSFLQDNNKYNLGDRNSSQWLWFCQPFLSRKGHNHFLELKGTYLLHNSRFRTAGKASLYTTHLVVTVNSRSMLPLLPKEPRAVNTSIMKQLHGIKIKIKSFSQWVISGLPGTVSFNHEMPG